MRLTFLLCILCCTWISAYAQAFQRIGDIYFGTQSSLTSINQENQFASFSQFMLFASTEEEHGNEPWAYDGHEVYLLADIWPGEQSSLPKFFTGVNDRVIFNAASDEYGWEWWVTDGTPEGTQLLIDLWPGPNHGVTINDWWETYVWNGYVYFPGSNNGSNYELWKTNGTPEGTTLVKDIKENTGSNFSSDPGYFTEFKDKLVFSTEVGVYETDGTEAGTKLITDAFLPTELIGLDEYILMVEGDELIRSDGTAAGTELLRDFASFTSFHSYLGPKFRRLGDFVLFGADDAIHGEELWRSDGTPEGTFMVLDIDPGINHSTPTHTTIFKDTYYFRAGESVHGSELWRSDGTAEGTQLVKDILPGSSSGFTDRLFASPSLEYMFLNAGAGADKEVWVSDGTAEGTYAIEINPEGKSDPFAFNAYGIKLFFYAITPSYGYEPFILDPALLTAIEDDAVHTTALSLFPNPTTGAIQLVIDGFAYENYTLQTMDGVVLRSGTLASEIDMRGLQPGMYMVVVRGKGLKTGIGQVLLIAH